MIITKLTGEIIYFSPLRVGAHDQSHWNELNLRTWFENKAYGILGDGGFTFNRKDDVTKIDGKKPHKRPKKGRLTLEQKDYNRSLSQMRVVVENSIRRIKEWKILATTFRHWCYGRGQIDGNDILRICIVLANRKIQQNPPRSHDWIAPDWREKGSRLAGCRGPRQGEKEARWE